MFAAPSVVAAFPEASLLKPAVISILSSVLVSPSPSAAKPDTATRSAALASVRVIVITVALVIIADVISPDENVTPALLASPSRSQTNFVQSTLVLTSALTAAIVLKLVPAKVIVLATLSYAIPVIVLVGPAVSITMALLSARLVEPGTVTSVKLLLKSDVTAVFTENEFTVKSALVLPAPTV